MAVRINPNLDDYMARVDAALTSALRRGWHAHAAVRVDVCGSTNSGPVLEWTYNPDDQDTYGSITLVNYRGDHLTKPLTDTHLYDVRPCWDRCEHAPQG